MIRRQAGALSNRGEPDSMPSLPGEPALSLIRSRPSSSFPTGENNDYFSPISTSTPVDQLDFNRVPQSPERPPTPIVTSPTVFGLSRSSLEGVVTIEKASEVTRLQRSKYAGKNSTQVLAKSAEELFQDEEIRIRVMNFFRPLMALAEDIEMPLAAFYPPVERHVADKYLHSKKLLLCSIQLGI